MNYEWGRAPEAGKWQHAMPVWFMSVIGTFTSTVRPSREICSCAVEPIFASAINR